MSKLEQKLKENRNRRRREVLLGFHDDRFRRLILAAEYSHESCAIKHAAFATWDMGRDDWTTTRGPVSSWHKYDYASWDAALSSLQNISFPGHTLGWLFFETDGPYFKVAFDDIKSHLDSISSYLASIDRYDFGWVGADSDIGVIVEFEHTGFCKNDVSICVWQA